MWGGGGGGGFGVHTGSVCGGKLGNPPSQRQFPPEKEFLLTIIISYYHFSHDCSIALLLVC